MTTSQFTVEDVAFDCLSFLIKNKGSLKTQAVSHSSGDQSSIHFHYEDMVYFNNSKKVMSIFEAPTARVSLDQEGLALRENLIVIRVDGVGENHYLYHRGSLKELLAYYAEFKDIVEIHRLLKLSSIEFR
jgi:hypothetical protein